jgi:peptidoglycan/xylan/chitin deacetylase (PgdA/CDA1 family)
MAILIALFVFVFINHPLIAGCLTKQTVYLWFLNSFHISDSQRKPTFMLIDDDSGMGIFKIHEICERLGVKATFAVVPAVLDSVRIDSLKAWHRDGYGIALHGYNHGRWKEWTSEEIVDDINKSIAFLVEHDMASSDQIRIVVTPCSYNTQAIRKAIDSQDMKMVMGACIVNPDTTTFQWGRMFISKETDMNQAYEIMEKANAEKGFIIFGTHSSNPDEFSAKKTEAILKMVIQMGFTTYQ